MKENNYLISQISEKLPDLYQRRKWELIFTPIQHGFRFREFLIRLELMGPHIILIKDNKNSIFGAFVAKGWKNNKKINSTSETFLFTFHKTKFITTYPPFENDNFQYCNEDGIIIGLASQHALFINNEFTKGASHPNKIYKN